MGKCAHLPALAHMTPKKVTNKGKRKLTPDWEKGEAFEVPAAVRPAVKEPRGAAHHTLFTPPGASDTTIHVRRP